MTELTKKYSGDLVERNTETLKAFSVIGKEYTEELKQKHQETIAQFISTSKEIQAEQNKVLRAITDPLKIKN